MFKDNQNCPHCGVSNFRRSGLRIQDIPHLLLFEMAARCHCCQGRFYVDLSLVARLQRAKRDKAEERD
jgi:transposase